MAATVDRRELGSLKTKLVYGLGSVAFGVKDFGFGTLLLFYYNQVIGLPAAEVSFAIALVLVFDAFADPIVGQISDNLRTRLGRRHPLMYASAIPVAVSYFFLWVPPAWSHEALFFYLVAMAMIVRTCITLYEIPSSALIPEMTDDYHQRTTFVSFRYFFGVGGAVAMGFLTYRFLLYPDATHAVAQLNPAGYPRFALASAIIMITSILLSARGTQRFVPLFREPPQRRLTLGQVLREMGHSLAHPQFLILVSAAIFGTVAIGMGSALALYFNTYFWGLTTAQLALFTLTGIGSAIVSPLIAMPLSKLLGGKKNAALLFYFLCVCLMAAPISLRLLGFFPPNGSTLLLVLLFAERILAATMGVGCLILFSSMMADVVDDSALRTGRRSEGLFFASMGFIAKMLSGAGTFLAGQLLSFAQFPDHANPATIDPAVVRHLAELYLPCLVGFYAVGIVLLSRYRISREQHEDNVRRLNEGIAMASPKSMPPAGTPAVELAAEEAPLVSAIAAAPPAE
jgi:Na+/melibiose symporter-like transporter